MTSLPFLAYIAQITTVITQSAVETVSFWMWGLFLASNAPAIAYAVENKEDWRMAFRLVMPLTPARSS